MKNNARVRGQNYEAACERRFCWSEAELWLEINIDIIKARQRAVKRA